MYSVKAYYSGLDESVSFNFHSPYSDYKRLTIFSTLGKKIFDGIVKENRKVILLPNYSDGKYYYHVYFTAIDKSITGSFVKLI